VIDRHQRPIRLSCNPQRVNGERKAGEDRSSRISLPGFCIGSCTGGQFWFSEIIADQAFTEDETMLQETEVDDSLLLYLHAANEADEERQLGHLLDVIAKPILQQTLQRAFLQNQISDAYGTVRLDMQDAVSNVLTKILQRLRMFKADPANQAISNFRGLVAMTAYRSLMDHLRGQHRQRASRDKKIRRILAANRDLTIWKNGEGSWLCGYNIWRNEKGDEGGEVDLTSLIEELRADGQNRDTATLILQLLEEIGRPLRVNDLINATVVAEGLESETVGIEALPTEDTPSLVSGTQDTQLTLEAKSLAKGLLNEIRGLEPPQRQALLLNMKDSHGYGIEWFLFAEIATEEQLAELLEVSVQEFIKLIPFLPLTDQEIGLRLGIAPAKVANMRKAVRDRLQRFRRNFNRKA
jgi:DNA-directed RNA polymerase specialized sigma24 family protein